MGDAIHLLTTRHRINSGKTTRSERQEFWCGIVKVRELPPDITEEEYLLWWPRLSEREKERHTAYEAHNVLTLSGFNQLLTYVANAANNTASMSQYFSVGTFPIISVQTGDTSVLGEIFRKVPTSNTIVGNQLTLSTLFTTAQGNGTLTNAGLWGINATGTLGSGTLMTHTIYNYIKTSANAVSNDYLITLS